MPGTTPPPPDPATHLIRGRLLDWIQAGAVLIAILAGFATLGLWARALHRDVKRQVDRIEAEQHRLIEYTRDRDDAWAKAIGLPWPPRDEDR